MNSPLLPGVVSGGENHAPRVRYFPRICTSILLSQLTTLEDFSQSLEALKLFPQETLTLEEK